jgi:hypothetical protein
VSMRKIRDVLRLTHALGMSRRLVGEATGIGKTAVGEYVLAKETDRLIRLSTGVLSTPPSPAVRNHRIAVRLALETVSALHRIPQ